VPSSFNGAAVTDGKGVRHKFHEQFSQPRFHQLLRKVFTYWQKDDHDFRCNDCDPYVPNPISREAGAYFFREQLPVVHPVTNAQPVFRSYRINDLVQIWLVDTREYRSRNAARDGPEKTLWGTRQHKWLKATLSQSDAVFKLLISPTPMVGPDGYGKNDNHANLAGFRYEREAFFSWLRESGLLEDNFYLICGDRHWQYHAIDPSGVEEFSVGTLVDANAVVGFFPGDETSSDPEGEIRHLYHPEEAKGGFLNVSIDSKNHVAMAKFSFYDVRGKLQYQVTKKAEYQGGERAGMDRIRHSSGWPNE
jgi:alkaline phosphatase/alkaline phosphatase D